MGGSETIAPTNSEKTAPPVQPYYGPGMIPPAYYGATVPPGHAPPPYMWASQPILPPFGSPYAAMYPPGCVYPHPGMPFMATPLNMTMQPNVVASKDKGVSGTANDKTEADGIVMSHSGYDSAEGSNDGTDENNAAGDLKNQKKQRLEGTTSDDPVGAVPSSCPTPPLNPRVAAAGFVRPISTAVQPGSGSVMPHQYGVPSEPGTQNDRMLKREKRKQSNRESARRSRLKKQAEIEELAVNVERLNSENANFRSEISRLTESSHKLRLENTVLMETLKLSQSSQAKEVTKGNNVNQGAPSVTENFGSDR